MTGTQCYEFFPNCFLSAAGIAEPKSPAGGVARTGGAKKTAKDQQGDSQERDRQQPRHGEEAIET